MSCAAVKARKHGDKWTGGRKKNGSREKCKTGTKRVSYCPHCHSKDVSHPESAPRVVVGSRTRVGTCGQGHSWVITGSQYSTMNGRR